MHSSVSLSNFPGELQDQIIINLHPSAAVALRQTNIHFHNAVSLSRLDTREVRLYLHERQTRPQNADKLACYTCLILKPKSEIMQHNSSYMHRQRGIYWHQRCLDCAIENFAIVPGNIVETSQVRAKSSWSREKMVFCLACLTLQGHFCGTCRWCFDCTQKQRACTYRKGEFGYQMVPVFINCRAHSWYEFSAPELITPARTPRLWLMQSRAIKKFGLMHEGVAEPEWFDSLGEVPEDTTAVQAIQNCHLAPLETRRSSIGRQDRYDSSSLGPLYRRIFGMTKR